MSPIWRNLLAQTIQEFEGEARKTIWKFHWLSNVFQGGGVNNMSVGKIYLYVGKTHTSSFFTYNAHALCGISNIFNLLETFIRFSNLKSYKLNYNID